MELAVSEAKRAGDRGDYPIGAVITRLTGGREVVIASAYGRYLSDFVLYSTHEPCAMCAGACVWSRIGALVYGVSQEDIAAYGRKHGTDDFKWRACLLPCRLVFEKGNHLSMANC
jgi:tRNA(Arg) A34 adenosine deaminase TadA